MADFVKVPLPNGWPPREHQLPFSRYMDNGLSLRSNADARRNVRY